MTLSLDFNTLNDIPKSSLSYVEGFEFSVLEFFPPEPQIKTFMLSPDEALQGRSTDVLRRCLAKKPLSGRLGSRVLHLKIRKAIRVGDGKTSQIVLVDVVSGQGFTTPLVAKLYDPLYYDHSLDDVDPSFTSISNTPRKLLLTGTYIAVERNMFLGTMVPIPWTLVISMDNFVQ